MIREGESYKEKMDNAFGIVMGFKALEKFGEDKVVINKIISSKDENGKSVIFINEIGNERVPNPEIFAIAKEVGEMKVNEVTQYIFDNVKDQEQLTKSIAASISIMTEYGTSKAADKGRELQETGFDKIKIDEFKKEYIDLTKDNQTREEVRQKLNKEKEGTIYEMEFKPEDFAKTFIEEKERFSFKPSKNLTSEEIGDFLKIGNKSDLLFKIENTVELVKEKTSQLKNFVLEKISQIKDNLGIGGDKEQPQR